MTFNKNHNIATARFMATNKQVTKDVNPNKTKGKATITRNGLAYVVTYSSGETVTCRNLATARFYANR